MTQAIVITSGKGGSGKSTVACLLGLCLADAGKKVALVDMDMGMRSLDLMLGLENKVVYDLADVAEGVCRLKQALVRVRPDRELFLLSAAHTRGSDALTPHQAEQIIEKLKRRFDCVLIDCPAGVGRGFRNAAAGADSAILVLLPGPVALRDAERVAGLLAKCDIPRPMLVMNRVSSDEDAPALGACAQSLGLEPLGWIPDDRRITGATPLNTQAGQAIRRIARRLGGEAVPIPPQKRAGTIKRLLRAIAGR